MIVAQVKSRASDSPLVLEAKDLGAISELLPVGAGAKYQIEFVDMPEEEFKALGDFNGF
ncbi:hypothetical protein [Chromobacterium haemolyticum]|uniref:hypothetical protein n=1 Tax=Chromobacterium haemolyticum TaxID=394935 RepID=UPI00244C1C07|nr:hypothetical protein [Chromobacterium haemolyticum]MDH0341982.1 hypothetical protein [Chromobacterium haemolyticum]